MSEGRALKVDQYPRLASKIVDRCLKELVRDKQTCSCTLCHYYSSL